MTTTKVRPDPEARVMGVELREVETTDSFSMMRGRAVPYGEDTDIGWFLEQFAPGSLGKSARESAAALPLLLFHDHMALPIGSIARWDEQPDGLYGEWRLAEDSRAQEAAKSMADGHLNFMSIRFQPIRSTWTFVDDYSPELLGAAGKDRVVREEARLLETSALTTPAYNSATVQWVRSSERRTPPGTPSLDAWRTELDKLRSNR